MNWGFNRQPATIPTLILSTN